MVFTASSIGILEICIWQLVELDSGEISISTPVHVSKMASTGSNCLTKLHGPYSSSSTWEVGMSLNLEIDNWY